VSLDSGSQSAHCDQEKWFLNKKIERVAASTLAQIQAVPAQSIVDFEVEDDDVDIANEMLDKGMGNGGGGVGEGGCCFSPVVVGWVGEHGGEGYGIEGALDLDIYIYTYIYLRIFFENINSIPRFGDFLVLTSSRVSCICLCVYILTRKGGVK